MKFETSPDFSCIFLKICRNFFTLLSFVQVYKILRFPRRFLCFTATACLYSPMYGKFLLIFLARYDIFVMLGKKK